MELLYVKSGLANEDGLPLDKDALTSGALGALSLADDRLHLLAAALAGVQRRASPVEVLALFCEPVWHPSLAALMDVPALLDACRLAAYLMLDDATLEALAQEAARRACLDDAFCAAGKLGCRPVWLAAATTPLDERVRSGAERLCLAVERQLLDTHLHPSKPHLPWGRLVQVALGRQPPNPGQPAETDTAARWGHLRAIQSAWLQARPWTTRTSASAAAGGHLALLQWLRVQGCPWDVTTCANAARRGHLPLLQWARAADCPWNHGTCSAAAEGGHLHILEWCRLQGCQWSAATCSEAAAHDHREVLEWARINGCPWNEQTCSSAAAGGHLELLQWARANGCPWDDRTCHRAAANGQLAVLQWARANGCGWSSQTCAEAASGGHLPVLQWLRAQPKPCPWDALTTDVAAYFGHLHVLQWAVANGCPWEPHAVLAHAKLQGPGRGELAAWVVEQMATAEPALRALR
jgi:hypothetical protein